RDFHVNGVQTCALPIYQVELTEALKAYVENKFQRLERHFDQIMSAQVVLTIEKQRQIAEATIRISGADLFASAEAEDMYAAIDRKSTRLNSSHVKISYAVF